MDLGGFLGNRIELEVILQELGRKELFSARAVCKALEKDLKFRATVLDIARVVFTESFPVFLDHPSFITPIVLCPVVSEECLTRVVNERKILLVVC